MKTTKLIAFTGTMVLTLVTPALAASAYVALGTAPPPSALGGYMLAAFPDDISPEGSPVTTLTPPATAPVFGSLTFSSETIHYEATGGWLTWSHGYTGDVYSLDELIAGNVLTMTLPFETKAFSFYLEPTFFGTSNFTVTVETLAGSSSGLIPAAIDGSGGATGFGFYTDDPTDSLKSITITGLDTSPDGFAVGEFAINAEPACPCPDNGATFFMLGVALSGVGAARRYLMRREP